MKIIMSLILLLILTGCTQTVVKYQCADGSFGDSVENCGQVNALTNCPELDCNACPVKTEFKDKIVEKPVEIIKYQCYDGTIQTVKTSCKTPEEVKFNSLQEGVNAEITIQRVQVQLANLYPTRVTVENTGKKSLTPKFDVVVKKGTKTVCSGSSMVDEFSTIPAGESKTGEFTIMGCMFESDGKYTITVDVLDSNYNKLDSDTESFEVDYWSVFS